MFDYTLIAFYGLFVTCDIQYSRSYMFCIAVSFSITGKSGIFETGPYFPMF